MNDFAKNLRAEWRRLNLPFEAAKIVVAASGGADSTALLCALHELRRRKKLELEIVVAHFNHNLRGAASDADQEFVKNLAEDFGCEFEFEVSNSRFQIEKAKDNLEQAARRARYDFLSRVAAKHRAFAILTAHTLDDQAETFLLRLVRGSGAEGLGAMRAVRSAECEMQSATDETARVFASQNPVLDSAFRIPHSAPLLVRPLLAWARRAMTEDYCRALKIEFRRDAMNDDTRFSRVRVRKELLPLLATFNPRIVETLAETADLLREDDDELNCQAEKWLCEHEFKLLTAHCSLLTVALRRRVLRLWLKRERGDLRRITKKHLAALDSLILRNVGNRTIELPGKARAVRIGGAIVYRAES